jgi:hypothetical protein
MEHRRIILYLYSGRFYNVADADRELSCVRKETSILLSEKPIGLKIYHFDFAIIELYYI